MSTPEGAAVSIVITRDQRALRDAVRTWAGRSLPVDVVRAQETEPDRWRALWPDVCGLGLTGLAVPDAAGGSGGSLTDLAVGLEEAATALVPGPLLTSALAALVADDEKISRGLCAGDMTAGLSLGATDLRVGTGGLLHGNITPALGVVADGLVVVGAASATWILPLDQAAATVSPLPGADFSRPLAEVRLDGASATRLDIDPVRLTNLAVTLAAAEASGVAAWCLHTATDYAKVREQFGRPIGSFQAIKLICAQMLCRAEVASALAWDAAEASAELDQHPLSAAVAAVLAIEAAVDNAKDCIQVLGGIGFTWEHEAHLYLRRALALRAFAGSAVHWRQRAARLAADGVCRQLKVTVDAGNDRSEVRRRVDAIAARPGSERRTALAESGYLVPHWPAPYGLDAPPRLQLLIDEELSRAGVVRPDLVIAGWALPTIINHGTPEQIERFVAPTLRGELTWCQLFSEPGAGSDLASLRMKAERADGGWSLTGQKVWTSLAHRSDWGVCLARTNPEAAKHRGITYFLVDMRSPGIDIRPLREITGEQMFNEVFLDGVFVPDELIVGEVDRGWPLARTTLSHERVAMGGGSSIGDAVEQLVGHARDTGAIADPVVAARLGGLVADGLAGALLDMRSALRRLDDRASDDAAAASVRKLVGVRHRQEVAETALDLLGADGLVAGEALQQFLMTRCLSIAGGTTQVLSNVAAERVLGLPRD